MPHTFNPHNLDLDKLQTWSKDFFTKDHLHAFHAVVKEFMEQDVGRKMLAYKMEMIDDYTTRVTIYYQEGENKTN